MNFRNKYINYIFSFSVIYLPCSESVIHNYPVIGHWSVIDRLMVGHWSAHDRSGIGSRLVDFVYFLDELWF